MMKKWTVDFDMKLYATFEGIEAATANEARDIAIEMFMDDPSQYLDFYDPLQIDVYEDEGEGGEQA